jgi:adenylate kinase family enzyme
LKKGHSGATRVRSELPSLRLHEKAPVIAYRLFSRCDNLAHLCLAVTGVITHKMPKRNLTRRVMIVGSPGSGKSTLAFKLSHLTQLPVFHLDKVQYTFGWAERPKAEVIALLQSIHTEERWIFEGWHPDTNPARMDRADMFVWLDIPTWTRLFRVMKRCFEYHGKTRPDMHDACPQRLNWNTLRFLASIVSDSKAERMQLFEAYQRYPNKQSAFRLTSQAQIDQFCLMFT